MSEKPDSLMRKVFNAVVLLLVVAVVARAVYELLMPLVPFLVVLALFTVAFAVLFGAFRRP